VVNISEPACQYQLLTTLVVEEDDIVVTKIRYHVKSKIGEEWIPRARIAIVTEGMLLNEIKKGRGWLEGTEMNRFKAILFDEIFEMSADLELAIGWARFVSSSLLFPDVH
jgi:hypothetical protein